MKLCWTTCLAQSDGCRMTEIRNKRAKLHLANKPYVLGQVSYDRVIGLDTMPLGSPSALLQLLDSGRPPAAIERATGDSSVSAEASLEMLQIFIALFLFRVCHVVRPFQPTLTSL